MESLWVWFFLLPVLLYFCIRLWQAQNLCKIPGPNFIEVARNFHLFGTVEHHKLLSRWSKIYGDIFQYSVLGKRFIVFNTPETIKSAFSVDERSQHPAGGALHFYTGGEYGITGSNHKNWLEQRKLIVQNLKSFGFRGLEMSAKSLNEDVDKIIEKIAENCNNTNGKALNLHECLQLPMMNMIWRITASSALTTEQIPFLLRYQTLFGKLLRSQGLLFLGSLLSLVKWEPAIVRDYRNYVMEFWGIQRQIIQEHMLRRKDNKTSPPKDYVDSYLNKMQEERSEGTSFEGGRGMQNLIATLMDVNVTGGATVFHSLEYMLLHWLVNQDLQNKVREEVVSLKGTDGKITLDDVKSLPYTEACIMEMIREFTPSPIVVKVNRKDGDVNGHFIPTGSFLIANLWGSNHKEDIWEDPFELKPERFLDETKGKVVGAERIMSFGAGRRKCLGYLLTKDMLLLLVARIIQRFQILPHPDHPIQSMEPQLGFFHQAPHFEMLIVDRLAEKANKLSHYHS